MSSIYFFTVGYLVASICSFLTGDLEITKREVVKQRNYKNWQFWFFSFFLFIRITLYFIAVHFSLVVLTA